MNFLAWRSERAHGNYRSTTEALGVQATNWAALKRQQSFNRYVSSSGNSIQQIAGNTVTSVEERADLHQSVRDAEGRRNDCVFVFDSMPCKIQTSHTSATEEVVT
jgi:hypothetical protein